MRTGLLALPVARRVCQTSTVRSGIAPLCHHLVATICRHAWTRAPLAWRAVLRMQLCWKSWTLQWMFHQSQSEGPARNSEPPVILLSALEATRICARKVANRVSRTMNTLSTFARCFVTRTVLMHLPRNAQTRTVLEHVSVNAGVLAWDPIMARTAKKMEALLA